VFFWKGTLVDLQTCWDSNLHNKTSLNNGAKACSYLVAFLRSKLQEFLSTPHQEQLQQQQTLRKDEPRELAKKQLLGGQVSVGACVLAESVWEVEERLLCNRTELLQSTKDATSTAQRSETHHSTLQGRELSKTCSFARRPSTGRLCLKLKGNTHQFRHCKLYCSRMPKGSVVLLCVCVPFTRRQLMFVHAGNCCELDSISSAKN